MKITTEPYDAYLRTWTHNFDFFSKNKIFIGKDLLKLVDLRTSFGSKNVLKSKDQFKNNESGSLNTSLHHLRMFQLEGNVVDKYDYLSIYNFVHSNEYIQEPIMN